MTAARLISALPALCMAAALLTFAGLVTVELLRDRRIARRAERRARPHSAHVGTAAQDAAAILRTALDEQEPQPRTFDEGVAALITALDEPKEPTDHA